MSDYFNLNEGIQKAKRRYPQLNVFLKRKYIIPALITLAIPLTVGLALVQQELRGRASGPEIASVAINPGVINSQTGSKPQPMSTLAYDAAGNPVFAGVTYEWSMSSTNSVGTLSRTQGEITEFFPLEYGCGQITVIARSGNQNVTKSVAVSVASSNGSPNCTPTNPTPTPTSSSITFGKALKLNGVDSCAEITSPTSKLDYASAQSSLQSTIEGWFRVDEATRIYSGFDTYIVSREAGKDFFPSMSVFIRSAKLNFFVSTSDDGSGNLTTGYAYSAQVIGTTPIQLNKWYHFAGIRDNGVISLYLNGKKDGISSKFVYSNNLLAKDGSLGIGCYKDSRTGQSYYGGFIKGQIDEIRASNKVRYTQDFIAPQPVPFIADEYTLALWHMDGSLVDSSKGSENNADPIGKVDFIDSSIGEPITPTPTPTPSPSPAPISQILKLAPSADSYVRKDQPTTNFGGANILQTDSTPNTLSFLKFNLASLTGKKIISAKLILKLNQASGVLQSLRREDDKAWSEKGVTFNNKPSNVSLIKTFNAKPLGSTIELDVAGAVNLKKGGNLTLGITSAGNDIARFYSREAAAGNRPQLIVEYQ